MQRSVGTKATLRIQWQWVEHAPCPLHSLWLHHHTRPHTYPRTRTRTRPHTYPRTYTACAQLARHMSFSCPSSACKTTEPICEAVVVTNAGWCDSICMQNREGALSWPMADAACSATSSAPPWPLPAQHLQHMRCVYMLDCRGMLVTSSLGSLATAAPTPNNSGGCRAP